MEASPDRYNRAMMPLSAVIFDMDGLLIDSERVIMQAWLAAAADVGIALAPDAFRGVIGLSGPETRVILARLVGGETALAAVASAARARLRDDGGGFPLKAGAADLLASLAARGVPCAVASSSRRAEIDRRLAAVGVRDRFVAAAGGDEVDRGKPDPAVYRLAASRLGVDPRRCLAFEDSGHGLAAALAAGMSAVHVPDLSEVPAPLRARCVAVLPSLVDALAHLPRWFTGHPPGPPTP